MKKKINCSGFTLVELIVSIVLVSFISVFFYYLIVNFKKKLNNVNAENEILIYQSTIMKVIYDDLSNEKLLSVHNTGNKIIYKYISEVSKTLIIDISNNELSYDGIIYSVPIGCALETPIINDINDTEKTSSYNNIFSTKISINCNAINETYDINIVGIY